jgi:hypothetical protein
MAIYHLTAKTGTRLGGQSARAKADYIQREGRYTRDRADELIHAESGHLPAWAEAAPVRYWEAADLYERANGRLFKEIEFALPLELSQAQQIALAREFAAAVTNTPDGPLPYTFALHAGQGENPHCHLLVSERVNDGHARTPATWFKRAATGQTAPERGGAKKTEALKPQAWLEATRVQWADLANGALARAGLAARIDHRSLAALGVDRVPTQHLGPAALGYEQRTGQASERRGSIEEATARLYAARELHRIEQELAQVNRAILDTETTLAAALREREASSSLASTPPAHRFRDPWALAEPAPGANPPRDTETAGETLEQTARRVLAGFYDEALSQAREAQAAEAEQRAAFQARRRRELEAQDPGPKPLLFGRKEWEQAHERWVNAKEEARHRWEDAQREARRYRQGERDHEFRYSYDPSGWQFGPKARQDFARQYPALQAEIERVERERKEAERRERERPRDPNTQQGRYTGRVVAFDERYVYQEHGGQIVRHERRHFERPPQPGQDLRVQYRHGQAEIEPAKSRQRERGLTR